MAMHNNIDGRYILFPDGSAWEYRRIRGGEVVSATQESYLSTHLAGRDHLAWLGDVDFDALDEVTDIARCKAILAACDLGEHDPQSYVICEIAR